jgi:hypothetical protein
MTHVCLPQFCRASERIALPKLEPRETESG